MRNTLVNSARVTEQDRSEPENVKENDPAERWYIVRDAKCSTERQKGVLLQTGMYQTHSLGNSPSTTAQPCMQLREGTYLHLHTHPGISAEC